MNSYRSTSNLNAIFLQSLNPLRPPHQSLSLSTPKPQAQETANGNHRAQILKEERTIKREIFKDSGSSTRWSPTWDNLYPLVNTRCAFHITRILTPIVESGSGMGTWFCMTTKMGTHKSMCMGIPSREWW